MTSHYPVDLGLSISIAIFVLSFSWLFTERTNKYPRIRRWTAVLSDGIWPDKTSPNFRAVVWGLTHLMFWLASTSFSFFLYAVVLDQALPTMLISLIAGPFSYLLTPQVISAATTILIIWRIPDDPALSKFSALEPYEEGNRTRNMFMVGLVVSLVLTYALPTTLWILIIFTSP